MDSSKLRAWWSYKQGLDGRFLGASAATVLAETGWARSVGGVGPYLTLHARAGLSRESVDRAVADLEICELPSARGCTYVLPAKDYPLGLAAGEPFREPDRKLAYKLGVTDKEIEVLCSAVIEALAKAALSPDELRAAIGGASRSLGEEGKKKGMTTTLPLALGKLQAVGEIRRIPVQGRLDQQRYKYELWRPNPRSGFDMEPAEISIELARKYFKWIGPSTLADFQVFSALGVGAAKAAVATLGLVPLEGDPQCLMLPEDRDRLAEFQPPTEPNYVLISSLDGIGLLRRDIQSMLDPADHGRAVFADKKMVSLGGLGYLPAHAILDRGRLVGLWEFEPSTESIVWTSFIPKSEELKAAVATTEAYVRDQLGDARSFSLDSPKSREPAIAAIRNMKE